MIETNRLLLRQWTQNDIPAFIELNADADVMEFFPSVLEAHSTIEFVETSQTFISSRGWGFWAVELKETEEFIGMVGLNIVPFTLPEARPDDQNMEVGWRLAKRYWGNGYASEAGQASLNYAFQKLRQQRVFAFTPVLNQRSRRVMDKLHMSNLDTNFQYPRVPADSALAEHVLYMIDRTQYMKTRDWI